MLLAVAAVALPGSLRAQNPTLIGTVGPGFSISLTDGNGTPVKHLDPGTYTVVVHDRSDIHNFHLFGPGVDMATDVEGIGDVTWTVTFADGVYTYRCDPHRSTLIGDFTVGNVPEAKPPPPPPPPQKLLGKVGPGRTISLTTAAGARVRGLLEGTYVLLVRDLSSRDNFHLTGPGVDRKTGIAAKRTVIWRLKLQVGAYRYRSDARPALLKGSFLVKARPQPMGGGAHPPPPK